MEHVRRLAKSVGLVLLGVAIGSCLAPFGSSSSEAQVSRKPFASSIEQRQQVVQQLERMNRLMEKQLDLWSSGKVQVVVSQQKGSAKAK